MRRRGTARVGKGKAALCLLLFMSVPLVVAQRGLRRPVRPLRVVRPANAIPPIVQRALQASGALRFAGRRIVTLLKDGQPDRHEEIVVRDGPLVRVEFPHDGGYSGQVIVENGVERRHYLPRTNEVRVLPPRGEEGLQRLRAMARQGNVAVENGERIAGYPTAEVTVRDRLGNVLQRLAIEPDSGMVLRRRVYDATGVEAGGYAFTRIDLNPGPFDPALFRIERKGARTVTPYDDLKRVARKMGYPPVWLSESAGFRLDSAKPERSQPVLHQVYIGPGGRLSLYELRTAVNPETLRNQSGKRLHSLSWTEGGTTFVLLGPQDDATLARLRDAVVRG